MTASKDPRRVKAGKDAAARRWGAPRRLNLRDLTSEQRRVILALVDAQRAANEAVAAGADTPPDRAA